MRLYNDTVRQLQEDPGRVIEMKKLDLSSLHIKAFSDSSFANNSDLSSQLGFTILLCDKYNNCNILQFSSQKSRRITSSVLGAEVYAFAGCFYAAFSLKRNLESMTNSTIRLQMLTDSKSLFDVIKKCSTTAEKRLMIDIKVVRQAYEKFEFSGVGFVRSDNNPADSFTKHKPNSALMKIIHTNKCNFEIEQWISRTKKKNSE